MKVWVSFKTYDLTKFSRSTEDLLTVVSDGIVRAFNRPGATQAVALDIAEAFDNIWHAGLRQKNT